MPNENNTDQIRDLTNRVHFAGRIAEATVTDGTTKTNVPYISIRGTIRCGEDAVMDMPFEMFCQSKKKNGEDNKSYATIKKWAMRVKSIADDPDNATWADLTGSMATNDYVNREGKLVEGYRYQMSFISDFKNYACTLDLEGYLSGVRDEMRGQGDDEVATGRKVLRLFSRNRIGTDLIDYKRIIVPKELLSDFEDGGFEPGCTSTFYITFTPTQSSAPKKAGIGQQRVTEGRAYTEPILTGADLPVDEDSREALSTSLMKAALNERKTHLQEIEAAGYLGSSSDSSGTTSAPAPAQKANKKSIGTRNTVQEEILSPVDDEEFPF